MSRVITLRKAGLSATLLMALVGALAVWSMPVLRAETATTSDFTIGDRVYTVRVPAGYDPARPAPLLIAIHGHNDGISFRSGFAFDALGDAQGVLIAYPLGRIDITGARYWNATDGCCDLAFTGSDDISFIGAVIDDVTARYTVDRGAVYVFGNSNGAFMAHRVACDLADRVTAIAAVAGSGWANPARCTPQREVAVLQVHGDSDDTILYQGGRVQWLAPYPSASASVASWASRNGCATSAETVPAAFDFITEIPGAETTIDRYPGCRAGAAELWTMVGAPHYSSYAPGFMDAIWRFFRDHTASVPSTAPAPAPVPSPAAAAPAAAPVEGGGRLLSGSLVPGQGFAVLVFSGGTTEQLVSASGCAASNAAFWVVKEGRFVAYLAGTTLPVNNEWSALFAGGIPAGTPVIGRCALG